MPQCQKIKKGWLDQYGPERFDRLIFATIIKNVGLEGLRRLTKETYRASASVPGARTRQQMTDQCLNQHGGGRCLNPPACRS